MEDLVLSEVIAHDLAQGVDAPRHGLEGVRDLEGLESPMREQEGLHDAVGTIGIIGPAADDLADEVDPERPGSYGAGDIDRPENAVLQDEPVGNSARVEIPADDSPERVDVKGCHLIGTRENDVPVAARIQTKSAKASSLVT